MDAGLWGVIGVAIGSIGLKLVEAKLLPKTKQADIATEIRDELRKDIEGYKKEAKDAKEEAARVRREVDYWRRTYFALIEVLLKNRIDIPDYLLKPYVDDPTTPDIISIKK